LPGHLPLVAKSFQLSIIDEGMVFFGHLGCDFRNNGLRFEDTGVAELMDDETAGERALCKLKIRYIETF
jgi:hypothetical protein